MKINLIKLAISLFCNFVIIMSETLNLMDFVGILNKHFRKVENRIGHIQNFMRHVGNLMRHNENYVGNKIQCSQQIEIA